MAKDGDSSDAATPEAKLTIKVGDSELHLEAAPEVVRQEIGRVLDRLLPPGGSAAAGDGRDVAVVSVTAPRPAPPASGAPPPAGREPGPPPSVLERLTRSRGRQTLEPGAEELLRHATAGPDEPAALFAVDPAGQVLLQTRARTAAPLTDSLLLLLYGALTLLGKRSLRGRHLLRGARSLGFKLDRVPRDFGTDGVLAAVAGRHRSKTYRLTAAGIRHCEALIPGLVRVLRG